MSPNQIDRELERVESNLDAIIQQLVEMRPESADWPAKLASVAETLRGACSTYSSLSRGVDVRVRLGSIQTRVDRAQRLLESAAAFYCGCLIVRRAEDCCYARDGEALSYSSGARMQLEA